MSGHTIVIVDDEPELLSLFQDILETEGYHVVAVGHPGVIASAIGGLQPALFLIDIMLTGINGIAVAEQLCTGEYDEVPMVAISASGDMVQRAAGSGWFTDTLEKPFELDDLLRCIAQHVAA